MRLRVWASNRFSAVAGASGGASDGVAGQARIGECREQAVDEGEQPLQGCEGRVCVAAQVGGDDIDVVE